MQHLLFDKMIILLEHFLLAKTFLDKKILKEMKDVVSEKNTINYVEGGLININEDLIGNRIINIFFAIPKFIELTSNYETSSLYKILKIRLWDFN